MSRLVSRAEGWEQVYTAFANINFAAFDYNTVKQSILDYIKLYFPETFNDFIESSELIAIIESFAYIAELLAYRIDVTAHENFISTAQRRDSVLKLAKLISYKASRPLPARGLVKITSVTTTETLIDSTGTNLSGRTVRWNDTSNSSWKDQFILILNRVLDQDFGSVVATDRFQIQDVLFELYPMVTTQGVMPYSADVYGQSINMELVPAAKSTGSIFSGQTSSIEERRPQRNAQFTMLYGSDGLGDGSETTGFFCFTKQGSLQRYDGKFDGITPNQKYDIPATNVNDTDVWVNNIDKDTGDIIVRTSSLPYRRETVEGKYGEWVEVDITHAQNVIFNTNPKRNKYEIETVGENKVRLIFGDGEFADVPSGTFDIWARTSLNDDIVIPQASVVDVPMSFSYTDSYNQAQTFSFTVTLINSLTNASAAETTEHIRQTAPSSYYTQDRMVNGEDYNVYMRQNPTILKLRATNRTFAGDSKYITWHDSSNTYENVKMFGDDGILYLADSATTQTTPSVETNVLISTYIEPLLVSTDIFMQLTTAGVPYTKIRRVFNTAEKSSITTALTPPPAKREVDIYYNTFTNQWYAVKLTTSGAPSNVSTLLNFGGYQIIDLNGFASSADKAISYSVGSANPHTATIVLPHTYSGSYETTISFTWTNTSTFGDLLNAINSDPAVVANGVVASLYEGNIKLQAPVDPTAAASHVWISDTDHGLFTDITISTTGSPVIEPAVTGYAYPSNFIAEPLIKVRQITEQDTRYTVTRAARRIVLESRTTQFWNTNTADLVMDYDTLRSSSDIINILQANTNCNRTGVLKRNWNYNILGQELVESGADTGMADIHRVSVMATDENADRVPDYLDVYDNKYMGLADIIVPKLQVSASADTLIALPISYIAGMGDVQITATQTSGGITTSVVVSAPTFKTEPGTLYSEFGTQTSPTTLGWIETDSTGLPIGFGTVATHIKLINITQPTDFSIKVDEHVYFQRISVSDEWLPIESTNENILNYVDDYIAYNFDAPGRANGTTTSNPEVGAVVGVADGRQTFSQQYKRHLGRSKLNFAWFHFSPRYHLVDPSPTNIIDIFVITRGYFISFKRWLEDPLALPPSAVTPLDLRNDYNKLLDNRMASDTVVLHPGTIKLMFGDKAAPALQSKFKVIRSANSTMTDNQIKNQIVATTRNFFDIAAFEFGETFYFSELAAAIHMDLSTEISSIVLVPTLANSQFGDLLQVFAGEAEILYPDIGVEDIDIVTGFTATNLRVNG